MGKSDSETLNSLEELAEKAIKRGDYEYAAQLFKYLAVYSGVSGDNPRRREFAIKAGECYVRAAERFNNIMKAMMLYLKAIRSFMEEGANDFAHLCSSKIWELFKLIKESNFEVSVEDISVLRAISDYFADVGELEKATTIYLDAAEKSFRGGKILLAGRLYRSAGDCSLSLGRLEEAASLYVKAADICFSCQEYFEAAWAYCEAGFLLIRLGRFKEALNISKKAEDSCNMGQVEIFLKDLSQVCKLLSQGLVSEAREKWNRIRMKIKKEYAQLIEVSFQSAEIRS